MLSKTVSSKSRFSGRRWTVTLTLLALFALILIGAAASNPTRKALASTPPTVDGLFYGAGDNAKYWLYSTSEYGSNLYIYYDDPNLYVALVVDRSVNDNVFSPQSNKAYTSSAGWGPHRTAKRLSDSEFAAFTLRCDGSPLEWNWQQGYAAKVGGTWQSDETTGAGTGTPPPSYTSSSSLAWNLNTYEADASPPWNMYTVSGSESDLTTWKSPFDGADPDNVIGLEGYPATGPITFSSTYQWEWAMVYEWSVDLNTAGCGTNPVYVLTGQSHHSPIKNGDPDSGDDFCVTDCDQNDPFTDWGDLPNSYSTFDASSGPGHLMVVGSPSLGPLTDPEDDGVPTAGATGDDTDNAQDDDGVSLDTSTPWTNGATVNIDLDVQCSGTNADVAMWIDWDNSGTFEADEYYTFLDLACNTIHTVQVTVPGASDYLVGSSLYMRVRIMNDETDAPGGSLDSGDFEGLALNGEVEDYIWDFSPTAISLEQVSAGAAGGIHPALLTAALLLMAGVVFLLLRSSRKQLS